MKIHLWTPGMNGSQGGIQSYSWEVYQSLIDIFGTENIRAISLKGVQTSGPRIADFGKIPARIRAPLFALYCLMQAMRERPDYLFLTHVNLSPIALWVLKFFGIPYGVSIHALELSQMNKARNEGLSHAKQIFPVSHWTCNMLLEHFPKLKERCTVIANTFDAERFQPAKKSPELLSRYRLPLDAKIILTVGRLSSQERYKGVDQTLEALSDICASVTNCYYMIVGTGDDLERLKEVVKSHNMENRVIFCGYVPFEELPAHYQLCDVYAMPSRGEGFGITYLEALASGKPALAGNQDASREALLEGKLGVLVNPENPREIATALIPLLNKTYPDMRLFDPAWLRAEVVHAFGKREFTQNLRLALTGN
ncbi:MAG: glycosyltransferase [Chthoniobacterales bacterium]